MIITKRIKPSMLPHIADASNKIQTVHRKWTITYFWRHILFSDFQNSLRRVATEGISLNHCLDQDIDPDIFPLTCLEVVDARGGFDKLAGVGFIDGQLGDF